MRDEETCDKLQAALGRSSLVLTILESKGMEFDDVFIYDFLSTSLYSHKLSVLEELFKRGHHTGKTCGMKIGISLGGVRQPHPVSKDLSLEDHLRRSGEIGNEKES